MHRDNNIFWFWPDVPRVSQSPRNSRRKKEQNILRQTSEKAKKVFVFAACERNVSLAAMKNPGGLLRFIAASQAVAISPKPSE